MCVFTGWDPHWHQEQCVVEQAVQSTTLWITAGAGTAQICPAGRVTRPLLNRANSTQLCNTHTTWSSPILWLVFIPPKTASSKPKAAIPSHCPTRRAYKMMFKMARYFKYPIRPAAVTRCLPVKEWNKQTGSFLSRTCWITQDPHLTRLTVQTVSYFSGVRSCECESRVRRCTRV